MNDKGLYKIQQEGARKTSLDERAKHEALKGAMTGATKKRAMKATRNFESLRMKGRKTHDILKKYE